MTRSPAMRILFWGLLATFLAAIGWWLVWVPHRPERTFSAIPSSAIFVSAHRELGLRWDGLMANPLICSVLAGAGASQELTQKWRQEPAAQKWASQLGQDLAVLAYVPELGHSREPAWILASWLGWRAQSLKWRLLFSPGGLTRGRARPGQDVWIMRLKDLPPDLRVSLTVADGLLLACLSKDPLAVRHLLDVWEKQPWMPSVTSSGLLKKAQALRQDSRSSDWGWFVWPAGFGYSQTPIVFELDHADARELRGQMATAAFLPARNDAENRESLMKLLAAAPDALALAPIEALPASWRSAPVVAETFSTLGATGAPRRVWAALLGDAWSGRLRGPMGQALTPFMRGLKVPTLLVGVQAEDSLAMLNRMPAALDEINRRFGWGLISRAVHLGPFQGLVFEDTRGSLYGRFLVEERVAALATDGWLVLASNFGGLRKLVQPSSPESEPAGHPRYAGLLAQPSATGFFWADVSRSGAALRGTMGALSLALMTRQPEETIAMRRRMAVANAWLDGLAVFEEAALRMEGTGAVQRVSFALGPDAAARLAKSFDSAGGPR